MKCPACGFETPDSQGWCDFCKEPFRRSAQPEPAARKEPVPASPERPSETPPSAPSVPVDPASAGNLSSEKIFDLLRLDSQERVPTAPPSARYLAWAFLAVMSLVLLASILLAARKAKRTGRPPIEPPAQAAVSF